MNFENIDQLKEYLHKVVDDAEKLVAAVKPLPPADVEGEPGRGLPQTRVAKIEALQRKVEEHFARLPECLEFLEQVIQRIGTSLDTVSAKRSRLHNEEARGQLSRAQQTLEAEHNRAVRLHATLKKLIYTIGRALELAAARGFGRPPSMPSVVPALPSQAPSSSDQELDDLFSLGGHR